MNNSIVLLRPYLVVVPLIRSFVRVRKTGAGRRFHVQHVSELKHSFLSLCLRSLLRDSMRTGSRRDHSLLASSRRMDLKGSFAIGLNTSSDLSQYAFALTDMTFKAQETIVETGGLPPAYRIPATARHTERQCENTTERFNGNTTL